MGTSSVLGGGPKSINREKNFGDFSKSQFSRQRLDSVAYDLICLVESLPSGLQDGDSNSRPFYIEGT